MSTKSIIKTLLIFFQVHFLCGALAQPKALTTKVEGQGQSLIMLPGFTCPEEVWEETRKSLAKNYQMHSFTYAGFAGTPAIEFPWYPKLKNDLIAYLKENDIQDAIIIGHSMGGTLALDVALDVPDRISKLILVDALPAMSALMFPGLSIEAFQYDSPYNNQMLAMDETAFNSMAEMMAGNMTNQSNRISLLKKWMHECDRKTYVYGYTDLMKIDLREGLKSLNHPTLILGASFPDANSTKATFESQFQNLQNKRIEIAPESKHFVMFDAFNWYINQINTFLSN